MININLPHLAWHRVGSITFEEKLAVVDVPPVISNFLNYPQEDIEGVVKHPLWCMGILLSQRGGMENFQSSHHVLLLVSVLRQLVASDKDSFSEIKTTDIIVKSQHIIMCLFILHIVQTIDIINIFKNKQQLL